MRTKLHSSFVIRPWAFSLLAAFTFGLAARAPAQGDTVTISAAEFQRLVYSAHLHTQLAVKPDLEASLQVLLEMQRRNPNASPAALADLSRQSLQLYRTNAPAHLRSSGFRDEILAAYLDALRQAPTHTNFIPANLTLLNDFMLRPADYSSNVAPATLICSLVDSGNQRLFSSEGEVIKRQALVTNCVARAQSNAAFATAMERLLLPETQVSLADSPAEIIGNTDSPLHDSPTMQTLLALSTASGNGSLTVSTNQLMNLFTTEMQTIWDTVHTNLAVLAGINQSQPDLLAYLTNQAAIDANVQLVTAVQKGQPAKLACATAAILLQSKLTPVKANQPMRIGTDVAQLAIGVGTMLFTGGNSGIGPLVAGGLDIFNLFTGDQTPQGEMARQIGNIQTLMGDLSTNMNYRFDRVDQSLTAIFDTLNTNFSKIEIALDAQGRQIAQLNGSVDDVRSSLVNVQAGLNRLEQDIFFGFATSERDQYLIGPANAALFYGVQNPGKTMTWNEYAVAPNYESTFYSYAASYAADNNLSPSLSLDLDGADLAQQLAARPLGANLNYIAQFLATNLGQPTRGNLPLANPQEWFMGAYAYLQLAAENSMLFREKGLRLPAIINAGRNLTNFFGSLTLNGASTNWQVYNTLGAYYLTNLIAFNGQVSALEGAFATNNDFAVGIWRRWNTAAPRVTAAATEVQYAPAIPSITVARGFATKIAAGQWHNLALQTDGTVVGWGANGSGQTAIPAGLTNCLAVAAGGSHSLALQGDRTVVGWGDNSVGQTNIPAGLGDVAALAAGFGHSLALRTNGTVVGWGENEYGQTHIPAGLSNVMAIAAGANHSLALKADGTVVGWGNNYYGQATGVPQASPPFTSEGIVMVAGHALSNVVAIAAGEGYSLALLRDGTVFGWGQNSHGEATGVPSNQIPPMGSSVVRVAGQTLSNVTAIAAGGEHSLALKVDGTLIAWGDDTYGQTNVPLNAKDAVAMAGGRYHSSALKADGTVIVWGNNSQHQGLVPPALTWRGAIVAGNSHGLAVKTDGTVIGWGDNQYGQINIPAGLTNVAAVAAGGTQSLALRGDGTVVAWGDTRYGQITIPAGLTTVVAIAAGDNYSLALRGDGTVVGWGNNDWGQLNILAGLTTVVAVAAGHYHSLALKADGTVVGWGENADGEVDIPAGLSNVVAIAAGYYHSLALKADGSVVGWGENDNGQINIPAGLTTVVAIAAGRSYSLALKADGTVVGWGQSYDGQLNIPVGLTNVVAIAARANNNMALKADGGLVFWGYNGSGQNVPAAALTNVVTVAAGSIHDLALRTDGTVVGWGDNQYGQINVPAGLSNVVAIAAGGRHSLALKAGGTVVGWGDNYDGQITIPSSLNNVVAVAGGDYHSLALKTDGTVVGWGFNNYGQINIPSSLNNVVAVAAGYYHSLALKADGTVVAWGDNAYGESNIPAGLNNVVAIATGSGHSLALKADGTVVGWGDNAYGESSIPAGLSNVVAIAAGGRHSLALKAGGTTIGWGMNSTGQNNIPTNLSNVVAVAAGYDRSLFLTATGTGGTAANRGLSFVGARIPARVPVLLQACNHNTIHELGLTGSALDTAAARLSGAKMLLADMLELGMPYTLAHDDVLHGFLYGSESLTDTSIATSFLQTQNAQLRNPAIVPAPALVEWDWLSYLRFKDRLDQSLTNLRANGQPEIPRLVGHTLRLLNLLNDAWTQPTNSPPPALEMWSETNSPRLLLYGEPYVRYTLQFRDSLSVPGWTTTAITNLLDAQPVTPPVSGPSRFYRALLPVP